MQITTRYSGLPDYAFPRLRKLLAGVEPRVADAPVHKMSIGEPKHAIPQFAFDSLQENAALFAKYPNNNGVPALLDAIAGWYEARFGTAISHGNLMVLNGSREGLFNAVLALAQSEKEGQTSTVLIPNPFYQAYMMGARTIGAEPVFLNSTAENNFLPDLESIDRSLLARCTVFFLCTPSNPQGAIASRAYIERLLQLAEEFDFYVFSDECYSEIYAHDAPDSLYAVAHQTGHDPSRVVVFNSLSKRSNVPGFRSGFILGSVQVIEKIRLLRSYAGSPVPMPIQMASAKLWQDEGHVRESRQLYQEKFSLVAAHFGRKYVPQGGFFLWLPVEDGERATQNLWCDHKIEVLPGAYLAQSVGGKNPGKNYIRVALVDRIEQIADALPKIGNYIDNKT